MTAREDWASNIVTMLGSADSIAEELLHFDTREPPGPDRRFAADRGERSLPALLQDAPADRAQRSPSEPGSTRYRHSDGISHTLQTRYGRAGAAIADALPSTSTFEPPVFVLRDWPLSDSAEINTAGVTTTALGLAFSNGSPVAGMSPSAWTI